MTDSPDNPPTSSSETAQTLAQIARMSTRDTAEVVEIDLNDPILVRSFLDGLKSPPERLAARSRLKKVLAELDEDRLAARSRVEEVLAELDEVPSERPLQSTETHVPKRPSIVQIEAAKLRLVTDRRLGKESPEWLKRVAQGLPAQPEEAAATP